MATTEPTYRIKMQLDPGDQGTMITCESKQESRLLAGSMKAFGKALECQKLSESEINLLEKASPILSRHKLAFAARQYDHQVRLSRGLA